MKTQQQVLTWTRSVELALKSLDGHAHLSAIYAKVRDIRTEAGVGVNPTFQATTRRTLQQGKNFVSDGSGNGFWRLRSQGPSERPISF